MFAIVIALIVLAIAVGAIYLRTAVFTDLEEA
jgi:hypothetical protein